MWSFSWLRNGKRSPSREHRRVPRSPRQRASLRPRLEVLEDRCLLSGFGAPVNYSVGNSPQAVLTADLNGDGKLDLITANQGTYDSTSGTYVGGGVSVLLGSSITSGKKGNTFAPAQNYAVGSTVSLAVGDLNGDGKLDIVTGSGSVLLNNGDGTFRIGTSYTSGLKTTSVFTADLNSDGKLDIVAGSGGVFLGNGDGTFRVGPSYTLPSTGLGGMAVGDFNRDGKPDIVAASNQAVYFLPGNGDGTFGPAQTAATYSFGSSGGTVLAMTAADLNADGKLDLALTYITGNSVGGPSTELETLLGNGDGTFRFGCNSDFGVNPSSTGGPFPSAGLAAADFNHDGKLDLITVGAGTEVGVDFGAGDGTITTGQTYYPGTGVVGSPTAFTVGDFNGDGYPDLAVVGSSGSGYAVSVLLWNPSKR